MKFNVGDKVYCKKYGKGVCHKIDESSEDYMYNIHFKDGTMVWLSKDFVDRKVSPAKTQKQQ